MYDLTTIGGLGDAGDPPLAQAIAVTAAPSVTDRLSSIATDVVAQRTGLLVGLAVGAAATLLYCHLTGGK